MRSDSLSALVTPGIVALALLGGIAVFLAMMGPGRRWRQAIETRTLPRQPPKAMNVIVGNAQEAQTQGTGWFLGFSPWTRLEHSDLLHVPQQQRLAGLCAKWYDHPTGHGSGNAKPVSEGRTISILVGSDAAFRIEFCESASFEAGKVKTVVLARAGDFAAWGEGLFHRWHCLSRASILTLRWSPVP